MDLGLLWIRMGGGGAVVLAIAAAGIARTNTPVWLAGLAGAAAVGLAALGVVRVLPAVAVWQRGLTVEGRVVVLDERRRRSGSRAVFRTRIRFEFRLGGARFTGNSTWGRPSRTALLAVGAPVALCYDPQEPSCVFWEKDLPLRMPPLASA